MVRHQSIQWYLASISIGITHLTKSQHTASACVGILALQIKSIAAFLFLVGVPRGHWEDLHDLQKKGKRMGISRNRDSLQRISLASWASGFTGNGASACMDAQVSMSMFFSSLAHDCFYTRLLVFSSFPWPSPFL